MRFDNARLDDVKYKWTIVCNKRHIKRSGYLNQFEVFHKTVLDETWIRT